MVKLVVESVEIPKDLKSTEVIVLDLRAQNTPQIRNRGVAAYDSHPPNE